MTRSPLCLLGTCTALAAFTALGCGGEETKKPESTGPKHRDFTIDNYPIPPVANAVQKDDPLYAAQWYLLYETWGGEKGGWEADFLQEVLRDEPEVFGHQFEKFGFIPDPTDDLPIGMKRGTKDPTRTTSTCAPCHTGRLPDGTAWFGQPNVTIDVPGLDYALNQRWMAKGNPSKLNEVYEGRARHYGPGRFRIDSDDYERLIAANIPVHYNLSQRSRLSMVGGARNVRTDVYLSIGAQVDFPLAGEPAEIPFPPEAELDALVAIMGAHDPPVAPAQDAAQVAAGKAVFAAARCNSCHHPDDVSLDSVATLDSTPGGLDRIPGDDPEYPNGSIHADPWQYFMAYGDPNAPPDPDAGTIDPRTMTILKFAQEHHLQVGPTDGYVSLNLHGLWASAPYLNNGSVPTLEALLQPAAQRPATFEYAGFQFDTSVEGDSNQGHEFGVTLSDTDKQALIVYLKSL